MCTSATVESDRSRYCPFEGNDATCWRNNRLAFFMTLTQLRCIIAIADADLNITAAAVMIHQTQSATSNQLKQLEDELGFPVFDRHGRRLVSVTSAGRAVMD